MTGTDPTCGGTSDHMLTGMIEGAFEAFGVGA